MRTSKVRADAEDTPLQSRQGAIEEKCGGPKFPWWCEPPWLPILIVGGITVGRILMMLLFGI